MTAGFVSKLYSESAGNAEYGWVPLDTSFRYLNMSKLCSWPLDTSSEATAAGSRTPGMAIVIWSGFVELRISGLSVPFGSMRLLRIVTEVFRSCWLTVWPGSGRASSTTSRPPRRSRPRRKLRCVMRTPQPIISAIPTINRIARIAILDLFEPRSRLLLAWRKRSVD